MTGLGETLRKAREQAGLSLDDIEEITKIRRKQLEALESDDFSVLPAPVYVKGFVKTYATALGLKSEGLLELLPLSEPRIEMKPVATLQKPRRGFGIVLFALLFICVVGGLSVYLYNYYQNGRASTAPEEIAIVIPTSTLEPSPTRTATVAATQTVTPTVNGVEIKIRAIDRAWLAVYIDGDSRAVYNGTMEIGETQTFVGNQRIYIHCGNAGGVDVTINNQRKGMLGRPGEVVRLEWSLPAAGGVPTMRTVAASEQPFNTPNPTTTVAVTTTVAPPPATAKPASTSAATSQATPRPAASTPTAPTGH